jgi:hypothetical protein
MRCACLALLLLGCSSSPAPTGDHHPPVSDPIGSTAGDAGPASAGPPAAPLKQLADAVGVASDPAFTAALGKDGQRTDHTAPAALRALLAAHEVVRMSASQGYAYQDGRHELVWYFGELGLAGGRDALRASLRTALLDGGFVAEVDEDFELLARRSVGEVEERVEVEGPADWTGGQKPAAGIKLTWTVRGPAGGRQASFGEVLAGIPFLRDPRIDASIYERLAAFPVVRVLVGGPWTRSYDLFLMLGGDPDRAFDSASEALTAAGYVPMGTARPDGRELQRSSSGSFAQVNRNSQGVMVHIQPES